MASNIDPLEYLQATLRDPRVTPAQLRAFASDLITAFGVRSSSTAAVAAWVDLWLSSTPRPAPHEGDNVTNFRSRFDGLTPFRPTADAPGSPALRFPFAPPSADTSMIATPEKILAAYERAEGKAPPVEKGPEQPTPVKVTAAMIIAAMQKAEGK